MARAIWSGALTFGLVNIPVKLVTRGDAEGGPLPHAPRRGRRADPAEALLRQAEDKEVPYEHIVKGYEVSKGQYVSDHAGGAREARSQGDAHDRHPRLRRARRDRPDLLRQRPTTSCPTRRRARRTRCSSRRCAAPGRSRWRRSCSARASPSAACGRSTTCSRSPRMNHADEVIPRVVARPRRSARSRRSASSRWRSSSSDSLTATFEPEHYPDEHRERVLELVERKAEGEDDRGARSRSARRRGW